MTFTLTVKGLEGLADDVRSAMPSVIDTTLSRLADLAYWMMRESAGKHSVTGNLQNSIFSVKTPEGWYRVGHDRNDAPYAPYVIWGFPAQASRIPYDIVPKPPRKALRIPVGGGDWGYFAKVRHPGYAGDPYILEAVDSSMAAFKSYLDAAWREAFT